MKGLPIGQDSFENLLQFNGIYVDKTAYIHKLMTSSGRVFFLSRPRRFGKSLLLSTIKAIFEGRKELFKGLYIEDKIDWEPQPVLMLDMTKSARSPEILRKSLANSLRNIAILKEVDILYDAEDPASMLEQLILNLFLKTGRGVVVLVDEYDKSILDNMDDLEMAAKIRKVLQEFYVILKASSDYISFVMLTGVSKISQTSLFSGFNQYNDISFDSKYAGICGYTQQELEQDFGAYIRLLAENFSYTIQETLYQIKYWYNGYSWDAATFVYNPFSVLLLFEKGRFKNYWFGTGTPTFLLKLLKTKDNLNKILEGPIEVPETFADGQALENLDSISLLFQTGYLTIKSFDKQQKGSYELLLPNEEVKMSISELMLMDMSGQDKTNVNMLSSKIKDGFINGNTASAIENLNILLSNISYNVNEPNNNESHYHALFQLAMIMAGIDHQAERYNALGRTDSVLRFKDRVYVIEMKYAKDQNSFPVAINKAWNQIKQNNYANAHLNQGKTVHVVALVFTKGDMAFEEEILN